MTCSAALVAVVAAAFLGCAHADDENLVVNSFAPYFSYTPGFNVGGAGLVKTVAAGLGRWDATVGSQAQQVLSFELWGVDPACTTVPAGVKNACGIHIHFGVTCAADAGGHYWNEAITLTDPWADVTYTSTAEGTASLKDKVVITGLKSGVVKWHTLIVHDHTGARIACGIIEPQLPNSQNQVVPAFTKYFNYAGTLAVQGSGTVSTSSDPNGREQQVLDFNLLGVGTGCSTVPQGVSNACGIHIHRGTSCAIGAFGHYYHQGRGFADPWATVTYTSSTGEAIVSRVTVTTGLKSSEVSGHTLIIHDNTGARIACGIIQPTRTAAENTLYVHSFTPYTSYTPGFNVAGSGTVTSNQLASQSRWQQVLSFDLYNLDPACVTVAAGVKNSCGIHIHFGTSCAVPAGGHYWNQQTIGIDPWATVTYTSSASGKTKLMNKAVVTGFEGNQVNGHTLIIHDHTGARIACGIIEPQLEDPSKQELHSFTKYFSYAGTLAVKGSGEVDTTAAANGFSQQALSLALSGVDPNCATVPAAVTNACGVHIHRGTSCASDAFGHFYNNDLVAADPWLAVTYTSANGAATMQNVKVVTGLKGSEVSGHTMIVHDATGARVACGILRHGTTTTTTNPPSTCFPGDATVDVYGQGLRHVASLSVGDRVLVEGGSYEPILSFLHKVPGAAKALTLVHARGGFRASESHIVFTSRGDMPMSALRPGDELLVQSGPSPILAIGEESTNTGMYAPLTASGVLVVDGVVASIYGTPSSKSSLPHAAAHAAFFSLRVYYRLELAMVAWVLGSLVVAVMLPLGKASGDLRARLGMEQ